MSGTDRKAKAAAAAPTRRSAGNSIVVTGIVIILAIVVVVGGTIWSATRGAPQSGSMPAGVSKGAPFEPYASAKPAKDAPVVDVYEDFRCPACQGLEQIAGQTIDELAAAGKIRLRVHLMTVIDSMTGGESSAVAGSSAICAADQGQWRGYHQELFARQPTSETRAGFPTATYTEAAKAAGLTGKKLRTWQKCTDAKTYAAYVASVDDASVKAGVKGTPEIQVNGTAVNWSNLAGDAGDFDTETFATILSSGKVPAEMAIAEEN